MITEEVTLYRELTAKEERHYTRRLSACYEYLKKNKGKESNDVKVRIDHLAELLFSGVPIVVDCSIEYDIERKVKKVSRLDTGDTWEQPISNPSDYFLQREVQFKILN